MARTNPKMVRSLAASDLRRAADAIRILGHADRLKILEVLETEPRTVSDVQEVLGLEQATVSQHLARLRQYGIVQAERDGVHVYYEVVEPKVRHILECIRSCDL